MANEYSDQLREIYPDRDFPYFTKKIFLACCQREQNNLKAVIEVLELLAIDNRTKRAIIGNIQRSTRLYGSLVFGVMDNQILFPNDKRKELEE